VSELVVVNEARCPKCGPRRWFDCEAHNRHDIPCVLDVEEMRTELVCDCGESVLVQMEPVAEATP